MDSCWPVRPRLSPATGLGRCDGGDPGGESARAEQEEPSCVVIEDLDRLFQSQAVTPAYLLNAVDGLLAPERPVLWIATFNDAGLEDLQANILDRPGRFDRIFVIEPPDRDLIPEIVVRYTPAAMCSPGGERSGRLS